MTQGFFGGGSGIPKGGRLGACVTLRLTTRRSLLIGILLLQALVLLGGWVVTYRTLRHRIAASVEHIVLDQNARIAEAFAATLDSDGPLVYGSPEWQRVQERVEKMDLAGEGFVCLLDENQQVLCHPDLRSDPSLRSLRLEGKQLVRTDGQGAVTIADGMPSETITGQMNFALDGTHYVATRGVGETGQRLLVHQPEAGLVGAGDRVVNPVLGVGIAAGVLILGASVAGTWMVVRRYRDQLEEINESLEDEVARRIEQSLARRDGMILGLAKLADYRDTDTGAHLDRICRYATLLACRLRDECEEIDDAWIENLQLAASLHDIGKVGIPDAVLLKPGRLDEDERRIIERHPAIGSDTLIAIRRRLGPDPLLEMAIQITLEHHERWDGTGYPLGIAGEQIALSARVVALADVYDALTSARVYKPAMPHDRAADIIRQSAGSHFDPRVVEAFDRVESDFDRVRAALQPATPGDQPPAEGFLSSAA